MEAERLVDSLAYVHGVFNAGLASMFLYQGILGLRIRRGRSAGGAGAVEPVRRHRKLGPLLAPLGVAGFLAGLSLAAFDESGILEHPPHLLNGLVLVTLICSVFLASRRIRGTDDPWRIRHAVLGLMLLAVYLLQVLSGAGILLFAGGS